VRGRLIRLSEFDAASANRLFAEMHADAEAVVRLLHETFFGEGAPLHSSSSFAARAGAPRRG